MGNVLGSRSELIQLAMVSLGCQGYKCIYFAAIRNDVETEGESFPVYP